MWGQFQRLALLGAVAAFGLTVATPAGADTTPAQETATLNASFQSEMSLGSGGAYGFYVKPVGRAALLSKNADHVYDPASALKALYHLYAMRQVASGSDSLTNSVTFYSYPNSRNKNGNPLSPTLCPDTGDEVPANAQTTTLSAALTQMMTISNNIMARAIERRYGRAQLNALAAQLGMTNTSLDQIIGCGYDNGHKNATTLVDLGKLYESVSSGSSLSGSARESFYSLMDSFSYTANGNGFQTVLAQEEAPLGLSDITSTFLQNMTVHFKGGSYNICEPVSAPDCSNPHLATLDEVGLMTFPFRNAAGSLTPTDYVWGDFIADLTLNCFGCAGDTGVFNTVDGNVPELLRLAMRAALHTWVPAITPAALAGGTTHKHYSAQLTGSYGSGGPYTFALVSGALPAGLSLSPAGLISGTPTATGTKSVTIKVTDGAAHSSSATYRITILPPPLVLSHLSLTPSTLSRHHRRVLISFALSQAAQVHLTFARLTSGKLVGIHCRPGAKHGKRCTILTLLPGVISLSAKRGPGKLSRTVSLPAGSYELIATARAGAVTSKPQVAKLLIRR